MANIDYASMVQRDAFRVMAQLYPDEDSIRFFLEDLGLSIIELPPFGRLPAKDYWRSICRIVDSGRYADITLDALIAHAVRQYPANRTLVEFLDPRRNDDEVRVLCLSAGPIDQNRLRLGAEHRAVLEATARSRRPVLAILQPAARATDLINRIIDAEPHIVHFAGHGSPAGQLVLEDDLGWSNPVSVEALGRLLGAIPRLQSVVLTSCFIGAYAGLLGEAAQTVIGSPRPLADPCALAFVGPFYKALGEGWDVPSAYKVAVAAMDIAGCPPHEMRLERMP